MKSLFPGPLLPTTVVGSYPVVTGRGLGAILDPYKAAVRAAVDDQLAAGIDIISDGQVRGDMVKIFSSALPGVRGHDVVGPVSPARVPSPFRYTIRVDQGPKVKDHHRSDNPVSASISQRQPTGTGRSRPDLAQALARKPQHWKSRSDHAPDR
jgi:5-methyltetrahydropteroyltriglutamate--homocysteine methyltransferase